MTFPFLAAATSNWPFVVLAVSMAFLVVSITKFRLHAFIALIAAAVLAGLMSGSFTADALKQLSFFKKAAENQWVATLDLVMIDFGRTAGDIAISIALAAVIGMSLMESGAADKVVRRFLAAFGEKRAGLAILASTYLLSIPIFFDTMFMLMVPLAKALRLRTGKNYLLYLMCICIAGVMTHSLTVPHPGPLKAVEYLQVDAGMSIWWGILSGILPCLGGYYVAKWISSRFEVPLRETPGTTLHDLEGISHQPESALPSFVASITPVILPILLITTASVFQMLRPTPAVAAFAQANAGLAHSIEFIGNKNVALLIGTIISLAVLARQKRIGFLQIEKLIAGPLETAGMIILITSAGGAFGAMLRNIGVGEAIRGVAQSYSVNILLLAWVTAAVIRIAQGSATVAMLTTSAIMWDMINPAVVAEPLGYHRMYVFLAIGFGAFCCSWMNDSGFWVVSRLSGMTEKETLRSWTTMLTVVSIFGLLLTLIAAAVFPMAMPTPAAPPGALP
jgi:gluconate:H+ symporter, GntP family